MIETPFSASRFFGVAGVIAYRRVMVCLTKSCFSSYDAHGPPIAEMISYTPYGDPGSYDPTRQRY
ncbi:MAG: hypothetical protein ACYC1I_08440 [Acidimicrobiales bacterium]